LSSFILRMGVGRQRHCAEADVAQERAAGNRGW